MSFEHMNWRLSVNLRDRAIRQTVTIDFFDRNTLERQLDQFSGSTFEDWMKLYEFTNETGELLAFRASAYQSHEIVSLGGM